jgi:hypothetical protein
MPAVTGGSTTARLGPRGGEVDRSISCSSRYLMIGSYGFTPVALGLGHFSRRHMPLRCGDDE